ncbi:protein sidekick-2-like isoform X2 [Venturia canescens]|uniref:protein sidekick-2-like isoform X2 n=1 Tax=Venturia canescens TaxID=32260 RepID=UPI001C9BFAD4|nr:protein sidekick-2-like isoform X2 [Venturia canescens]
MKLHLILLIFIFQGQLYIRESYAKQETEKGKEQSSNRVAIEEGRNVARSGGGGGGGGGGNDDGNEEVALTGPVKEITTQTGGNANLPCKFADAGGATVTWLRRRNRQLLTIGKATYSVDNRFMIKQSTSDFTLLIRRVTLDDAGLYECQLASYPTSQRNFVRLAVTEAYSMIPGGPDLHIKQGSSLRLECQLIAATETPYYVFWYQQGRMINYDEEPGVQVKLTERGSILKVDKTKPSHGGNYTCAPSNAKPSSVMIHVIEALLVQGSLFLSLVRRISIL